MTRIIRYTLASMIGAFVAWGLIEITHLAPPAGHFSVTYTQTFLTGLISGLFVGVGLGLAEAGSGLSQREAGKCVLMGALIGMAGGIVGLTIGTAVYNVALSAVGGSGIYGPQISSNVSTPASRNMLSFLLLLIGRGAGWALVGASIGLAPGLATGSTRKMYNGAIGGFIGGGLGGSVFEILVWLDVGGVANFPIQMMTLLTYLAAGCAIGLFIGFIEEISTKALLLRLVGRNEGKPYSIFKSVTVIGRSEFADIAVMSDSDVAERHASITARERRHWVEDLGSPYGTLLNGAKITDKRLLKDGDVIEIGRTKFLFRDKSAPGFGSQGAGAALTGSRIPTSSHVCPFCGAVKDPNGNCDCNVGAAPVPGPLPQAAPDPAAGSTQRISAPTSVFQTQAIAGAPEASSARLVVTAGPYTGQTFVLSSAETQIGRDAAKDISLSADSTVSRNHSRISREAAGYAIYDLSSTNGTIVNGAKASRHELANGDVVQIGSTKLRFEI